MPNNMESQIRFLQKNQVQENIYFYDKQNGAPRTMFVGNSITHHTPKSEIGFLLLFFTVSHAAIFDFLSHVLPADI